MIYLVDSRNSKLEQLENLLQLEADDLTVGLISTDKLAGGVAVEIADKHRENVHVSFHAGLIGLVSEAVSKLYWNEERELEKRVMEYVADCLRIVNKETPHATN